MIYTELTKKAITIAYYAHHGQIDKGGMPYIFHPYHLAEQMDDEISTCAALLHDVVEDTDVTFEETVLYGDSSVTEGLNVLRNSRYLEHSYWDTSVNFEKISALSHSALREKSI